jgi:hypothetical protein
MMGVLRLRRELVANFFKDGEDLQILEKSFGDLFAFGIVRESERLRIDLIEMAAAYMVGIAQPPPLSTVTNAPAL